MAIRKYAKNIRIKVDEAYTLNVGAALKKTADEIFVHAKEKGLSLLSNKKIIANGDKH